MNSKQQMQTETSKETQSVVLKKIRNNREQMDVKIEL
jgi:hypothetical protein